ncbi:MAG TPA: hypothetical protein VLA23_06415, partial [Candidatus Limnocylindrales bacterium]|nr:hypothetical protein [Candidatus Limnocylindrales bacterium]
MGSRPVDVGGRSARRRTSPLLTIAVGALLAFLVATPALAGAPLRTLVAGAQFYAYEERDGNCRETEASLAVTETSAGVATLDFTYSLFGLCGGNAGLWYYDLTTFGAVAIPDSDLLITPGLRYATLDTELQVWDEECYCNVTIGIEATWRATGRDRVAVARLFVSGLSETYITNPI